MVLPSNTSINTALENCHQYDAPRRAHQSRKASQQKPSPDTSPKPFTVSLSAAKAEIEVIQKSYRDLAAWTYNERVRLMGALAALRGVQQANTEKGEVAFHEVEKDTENEQCLSLNAQIDELIEEEKCRLSRS